MTTYKTPDVYVEEISMFPPSVAEVETAIPAFIGYTEKVTDKVTEDLLNVPVKIKSMLEFEELYGGPAPVAVDEVLLDGDNKVSSQTLSASYYMYDSLRLFFKNGGGKCYIISVGTFKNDGSADIADFNSGLEALKKKDEPTLILFPDAVLLGSSLYTLQQDALTQCYNLQDRFCVFDLIESDAVAWSDGVDNFRNNIGINHLKYGSVYTPWIEADLGYDIHYRDIKGNVLRGGVPLTMDTLTDEATIQAIVPVLDKAVSDVDKINLNIDTLNGSNRTIKAKFITLVDTAKTNSTTAAFKACIDFLYKIIVVVDDWATASGGDVAKKLTHTDLISDVAGLINLALKPSMIKIVGYEKGAVTALTNYTDLYSTYEDDLENGGWGTTFAGTNIDADNIYGPGTGTVAAKIALGLPKVITIFNQIDAVITQIISSAKVYESTSEESLYNSHPVYKNIVDNLSKALTILPPSGAVVGAYAMVDTSRGVWKAPANVSLNSVKGVTTLIDNSIQDDLNIDVIAGKSINAIRPFTGKGTLIWGARTLAGNDNEWRYIPVRRFFNMVEESVKKSTYWAVFEPNDANTWIKIKSMIENYLTQKWRDGALAGAKPNHAFFVNVGLGTTMTAQDILEGRMKVEIGMAVVRPAEFIILKFSHKMQES